MKQTFYLIVWHEADMDTCSHSILGAYCSPDVALAKMREHIAAKFDGIRNWWLEDDEELSDEEFNEWIDEFYCDDEQRTWSYTDGDEVEHLYKVITAEIEAADTQLQVYAVLHTCINGVDNNTEVVGVYTSQAEAYKALDAYRSTNKCDDEDDFVENVVTVESFYVA
ncbi:MAG: hypothetical protein IIY05_02790 [Alistipes sp.]|nr:hypothetical protein [Alistipes sp.]